MAFESGREREQKFRDDNTLEASLTDPWVVFALSIAAAIVLLNLFAGT